MIDIGEGAMQSDDVWFVKLVYGCMTDQVVLTPFHDIMVTSVRTIPQLMTDCLIGGRVSSDVQDRRQMAK